MKVRKGFVTNSSSSSFIIGMNIPKEEMELDSVKMLISLSGLHFIPKEEIEDYTSSEKILEYVEDGGQAFYLSVDWGGDDRFFEIEKTIENFKNIEILEDQN